ncbi:MAG: nitronate monooxygenase [Rhodoglobus sp.]
MVGTGRFSFASLRVPIVAAPMAGGPSTPELVAAVTEAGGFGYLSSGNLTPERMIGDVERTRGAGTFGVNVFVPADLPPATGAVERYRSLLLAEATRYGVELAMPPAGDTDFYAQKVAWLVEHPVAVVSFTFGLPSTALVEQLHEGGTHVAATVTDAAEARAAASIGADSLVVQGTIAGGHRGNHSVFATPNETRLEDLLYQVRAVTDLPIVAAGGASGARIVREYLDVAIAVQAGTAFLLADEAGTSLVQRQAMVSGQFTETTVTRAFTGRFARGLRNRFIDEHTADAPPGYPEINLLTRPIRQAAAAAGDPSAMSLWAGTGFALAEAKPAAEIVRSLDPS